MFSIRFSENELSGPVLEGNNTVVWCLYRAGRYGDSLLTSVGDRVV